MKALVIAPQPYFSPRGTPLSVYYRTLVTAELGVKIDLLTYGEGQDVSISGVRIIRIPRFESLGPVRIGPSYQKLFLDMFLLIWAFGLLVINRYDFVHAHEEAIFFCLFLKPIFRFKLVYDMHSCLPQQLNNFKFTRSRFLIRLFKKLEDLSLRAADAIITICPDLADYVNNLIQRNKGHFLIENSIFEPVKIVQKFSTNQGYNFRVTDLIQKPIEFPSGRPNVVYAGTLEPYQGIDILIHAFKKVVDLNPNAILTIIGGESDQVKSYANLAHTVGFEEHVRLTGRVPQHLAQHYCSLASVLVSPRSGGTNTPLKIYEQLASGIPLVATNIYSHTQVLNEDVAILVAPNPDDMAAGIIKALDSIDNGNRVARNARYLYERKYSRPVYVEKMRRVLKYLK